MYLTRKAKSQKMDTNKLKEKRKIPQPLSMSRPSKKGRSVFEESLPCPVARCPWQELSLMLSQVLLNAIPFTSIVRCCFRRASLSAPIWQVKHREDKLAAPRVWADLQRKRPGRGTKKGFWAMQSTVWSDIGTEPTPCGPTVTAVFSNRQATRTLHCMHGNLASKSQRTARQGWQQIFSTLRYFSSNSSTSTFHTMFSASAGRSANGFRATAPSMKRRKFLLLSDKFFIS